jgi:NAD(P)-dependent dehydrogenase (short-subunit alcohol dehydrogenase family)
MVFFDRFSTVFGHFSAIFGQFLYFFRQFFALRLQKTCNLRPFFAEIGENREKRVKTAVITGAFSGIGLYIAAFLLQRPDFFVVLAGRNCENIEKKLENACFEVQKRLKIDHFAPKHEKAARNAENRPELTDIRPKNGAKRTKNGKKAPKNGEKAAKSGENGEKSRIIGKFSALKLDLLSPESVKKFAESVKKMPEMAGNGLDFLVLNAGILDAPENSPLFETEECVFGGILRRKCGFLGPKMGILTGN